MKQLDEYMKLEKEIHDYFGYVEDWVVIPMDERREFYWKCDEDRDTEVYYSKSKENLEKIIANDYEWQGDDIDENDYYTDEIYTQRFLPKWVYRGKDYTMIVVDTHTDGNKFLAIYDNAKEIKDE